MGVPVKAYTFVDGKTAEGLITAARLNDNFDALFDCLTPADGGLEDTNVKTGAKILCSDRDYTGENKITGDYEFEACPTLPAGSLADAALSSNIPRKNAVGTFSAKQTFTAGTDHSKAQAENFVCEKVSSLPEGVSGDIGRILYNTTDNKFYGWNGSAWQDLGYTGAYTGGAVRSYMGSGVLDDNDSLKFYFKTEGASPTVKIILKGEGYPRRYYVELAYHTHVFTGTNHLHSLTDAGHTHSVVIGSHGHGSTQYGISTHTHGIGGNTAGTSNHDHSGVTSGGDSTGMAGTHYHTLSLTSGVPSAYQAIESNDIGTKVSASGVTGISVQNTAAAGTNAYAGVNVSLSLSAAQKLYGKSLTVKIDGTNVTSNVLTATGWGAIGDGTGTHAFHTDGTGEMTASGWKSYAAGVHTLEILEPESGYGCGLMAHIETA